MFYFLLKNFKSAREAQQRLSLLLMVESLISCTTVFPQVKVEKWKRRFLLYWVAFFSCAIGVLGWFASVLGDLGYFVQFCICDFVKFYFRILAVIFYSNLFLTDRWKIFLTPVFLVLGWNEIKVVVIFKYLWFGESFFWTFIVLSLTCCFLNAIFLSKRKF